MLKQEGSVRTPGVCLALPAGVEEWTRGTLRLHQLVAHRVAHQRSG